MAFAYLGNAYAGSAGAGSAIAMGSSVLPGVGDLVIVTKVNTTSLSACSDSEGNTYTRQTINRTGQTSSAIFWSRLTVAWTAGTTVTVTLGSTGPMVVDCFSGLHASKAPLAGSDYGPENGVVDADEPGGYRYAPGMTDCSTPASFYAANGLFYIFTFGSKVAGTLTPWTYGSAPPQVWSPNYDYAGSYDAGTQSIHCYYKIGGDGSSGNFVGTGYAESNLDANSGGLGMSFYPAGQPELGGVSAAGSGSFLSTPVLGQPNRRAEGRPAFRVMAGGKDITTDVAGLTFSNVDPGGFEACSFQVRDTHGIKPGDRLRVLYGAEIAWDGVINEVGTSSKGGVAQNAVVGVGLGSELKRNPYAMIYVDRDLSHWGATTPGWRIAHSAYGANTADGSIAPDPVGGHPGIFHLLGQSWSRNLAVASFYDAGSNCKIAKVFAQAGSVSGTGMGDTTYLVQMAASDDDNDVVNYSALYSDVNIMSGYTDGRRTFVIAVPQRYAWLYFGHAPGGDGVTQYAIIWKDVAVYGDHDITLRPLDGSVSNPPYGVLPSEVVNHAIRRAGFPCNTVMGTDQSGYVIPHLVYREPTLAETIINDVARLQGWHWGVWEPVSLLTDMPTFYFTPPSPKPTCIVRRGECDELDVPKARLDLLYDTAVISYTDASGASGTVTVYAPNPHLEKQRTLVLNMGPGTQATAQGFGSFALRLSQAAARGGGSATLPATVRLPSGGRTPALLIRSGRDRLAITDLSDAGPVTGGGDQRVDNFRVARVETTVDEEGTPRTRVEFDGGADLLEFLQARLSAAAVVAGAG